MSKVINVILSGGVGSRLWPLSRKSKPKQYLDLFEGKSLFEHTISRNKPLTDEVLMVGSYQNKGLAETFLKDYHYRIICESVPRNTAAAIAFASFSVSREDILLVTPSDHMIENAESYANAIKTGIAYAKEGFIATFGISPNRPETGYGYIEYEGNDVLSFREKPNEDTAKEFLKRGNFLWNSGIFCFKAGVYLDELFRFEPRLFRAAKKAFEASTNLHIDEALSYEIPAKSIDYAVMERSELIKVVPSSFFWSDMGAFDSLYDYLKTKGAPIDEQGNMAIGTEKFVSFLGLQDTILVSTQDVLLVLNKKASQDVKSLYEDLEKKGSPYIS